MRFDQGNAGSNLQYRPFQVEQHLGRICIEYNPLLDSFYTDTFSLAKTSLLAPFQKKSFSGWLHANRLKRSLRLPDNSGSQYFLRFSLLAIMNSRFWRDYTNKKRKNAEDSREWNFALASVTILVVEPALAWRCWERGHPICVNAESSRKASVEAWET